MPIRVSAWRTARWTVTAASYWLSLLSRLTRLRLRMMLSVPPAAPVAAPPPRCVPCGPAQAASAEPTAVVGAEDAGELQDRAAGERPAPAASGCRWTG